MFTGIVEEMGHVVDIDLAADASSAVLTLRGSVATADLAHGDSLAVDGVCLTVVHPTAGADTVRVDVMAETLRRSTLGARVPGDAVNLERALRADGRFGGHIVQGHVDGVGEVLARTPGPRWEVVRIGVPAELSRYVVEKGSIGVDGVSLTVSAVGPGWFEVSLIPATLESTTLAHRDVGAGVNLEVDVLAKYVESLLAGRSR